MPLPALSDKRPDQPPREPHDCVRLIRGELQTGLMAAPTGFANREEYARGYAKSAIRDP